VPGDRQGAALAFVETFANVLATRAGRDTALRPFADALGSCRADQGMAEPGGVGEHSALAHLDGLLEAISLSDERFAACVRHAAGLVNWYEPYPELEGDPSISEGMIAGQVFGPVGIVASADTRAGLFLIGPNVTYPLHDHVSEEVYFVLSGSMDVQQGFAGQPKRLAPDDYSHTPPGMPHALITGDEPVLIAYCWIGETSCPVWWWQDDGGGLWRRYLPTRAFA